MNGMKTKKPTSVKENKPVETLFLRKISAVHWAILCVMVIFILTALWQAWLPFSAERRYRDGFNFYVNKRYKYAMEELERAVKYAPWETHYQIQLGKTYEEYAEHIQNSADKTELLQKTEKLYLRTLELDNQNPWYFNRLATVYQSMADVLPEKREHFLQLAEKYVRIASDADKNNPLFQLNLAYFLHRFGETEEAIRLYTRTIEIDGRILEARYNLADIFRTQNAIDPALEQYLAIYNYDPHFGNSDLAIGNIYIQRELFKEAVPYLESAFTKFSSDEELLKNMVAIYHRLENWEKEIQLYEHYLSVSPNETQFHQYYIQALVNLGQFEKALTALDMFLVKHSKNTTAAFQRNTLLKHIKRK